jgi:methionyl-tRNA synthetase
MPPKPFYITTPIYYVNDRPHIGHAYTSVACDVLARFKRLSGVKVHFLTGTDEHGQKVEKSATTAGVEPQQFVDQVSQHVRDLTQLMNISNDDFIRTTEPRHKAAAQAIWKKMQEAGHIYLGKYAGWYSVRDEAYFQESELVNGKAPTGADVEWVEEPSYFFDLSKWQDKLLDYYTKNPSFIAPESRKNEIVSFVKGGLKDLSVSRTTFSWGIPVPSLSPESQSDSKAIQVDSPRILPEQNSGNDGKNKHIMYVWLDALTNYISALDYPNTSAEKYKEFWEQGHALHMVGKDIIRFHTVYWPAFLMAANLPIPTQVFAHGWWTIEGEKMSKSLGNVIAPADLVNEFGLDQTRWFLLREVPFGNDGNFSREGLINRVNSELANNIGNLVQRTLSMIVKNCHGKVPECNWDVFDAELQQLCYGNLTKVSGLMDEMKFHLALEEMLAIATKANAYIDKEAPWGLKKTDPKRMEHVLYCLAECIRCIALLVQPVMPSSSSKILDQLSIAPDARNFAALSKEKALVPGAALLPPQPVFPRFTNIIPSPSQGEG